MNLIKMKTYILLSLVIISNGLFAQYDSIPFGDYDRTYLVHLPLGYTGDNHLPLVIAMHGGGGSALNMEEVSQLSIKADVENFIIVYPEGVKGGLLNIRTWNAGVCCGFASDHQIDDVGFINALLNHLVEQYAIDTNRIYATGMSNGGFMAYRLACELSDRIAAIAPVASSMTLDFCNPSRAVPIIHFHSYLDTHIPYLGGQGNGLSNHYNPPLDSVFTVWSNIDTCLNNHDTIINNSEFTLVKWANCSCETEIHYYITHDGGHSWPGGNSSFFGDPASEVINATDIMWAFFQMHSLHCSTSSIYSEFSNNTIHIFPNPSHGIFRISKPSNHQLFEIVIFNSKGEEMIKVFNQKEISIEHLPHGIYFVQIIADGEIKTEKIIKN